MTDTLEHGGRAFPWRWLLLVAAMAAAAVAAVTVQQHQTADRNAVQPQPDAQGYSEAGTLDGVTFWVRVQGKTAAIRTTGRLGNVCDASGPAGFSRLLLCSDSNPKGAAAAAFVPDTATHAFVGDAELHLLPVPGPFNLAVAVTGVGAPAPQGAVVAK